MPSYRESTRNCTWSDLKVRTEVLDRLDAQGRLTANELTQALRVPAQRVKEALAALHETGEVRSHPGRFPNGRPKLVYSSVVESEVSR